MVEVGGGCGGREEATSTRGRRAGPPRRRVPGAARRPRRVGGEAPAPQARHPSRRHRVGDQARPAATRDRGRPGAGRVRALAATTVPRRRSQRGRRARDGAVDLRGMAAGRRGRLLSRLARAWCAIGRRPSRSGRAVERGEGGEIMNVRLSVAFLLLVACGGGGASRPAAAAPPEVLKALQVPENPYRIIYTPPVNLA